MAAKHIEMIDAFIRTLMNSKTFHALVIESLPGWGKSTAIDRSLTQCKIESVEVGSYATPLHFYNTLCDHPNSTLVLDDCAGLFSDQKMMAILKAATWQSSGREGLQTGIKPRRVSWGSTSDKVNRPHVDFSGKIILLTNAIPTGKETEAFLSRCLAYRIRLAESDVVQMIGEAANSKSHFPTSEIALSVAEFLIDKTNSIDLMKISFRTLRMGYDFAETHPKVWRDLFIQVLPKRLEHQPSSDSQQRGDIEPNFVRELSDSGIPAYEQAARFVAKTGKSRRTYFLYKKRLGFSRSYHGKPH
jgi:hypothetical protein